MPLSDLFLTVLGFVLLVAWIWLVILVFIDIVRSRDLSGWAKALWVVAVAFVPWIGVFVYLGLRGRSMAERGSHWGFGEDLAP